MKYVIVTGGVLSGLGKGISTSSIGVLLKSKGLKVCPIKIDPYLNVDAGTMNPYQHGEVFVLDDGAEVDLDLGNYERFLDVDLTGDHNITTGKVYRAVIEKERRGDYLGKTVQIIPHITDEIKALLGAPADVVLSDMAANATGHRRTDHLKIIALAEAAVDFARETLAHGGAFLCKVLQGGTEAMLLAALKRDFSHVRHVKPAASRSDSAELYLLATGFRG